MRELNATELQRDELLAALQAARNWHNGDKWRNGSNAKQRAAWETHRDVLNAAIAKATQ